MCGDLDRENLELRPQGKVSEGMLRRDGPGASEGGRQREGTSEEADGREGPPVACRGWVAGPNHRRSSGACCPEQNPSFGQRMRSES